MNLNDNNPPETPQPSGEAPRMFGFRSMREAEKFITDTLIDMLAHQEIVAEYRDGAMYFPKIMTHCPFILTGFMRMPENKETKSFSKGHRYAITAECLHDLFSQNQNFLCASYMDACNHLGDDPEFVNEHIVGRSPIWTPDSPHQ